MHGAGLGLACKQLDKTSRKRQTVDITYGRTDTMPLLLVSAFPVNTSCKHKYCIFESQLALTGTPFFFQTL